MFGNTAKLRLVQYQDLVLALDEDNKILGQIYTNKSKGLSEKDFLIAYEGCYRIICISDNPVNLHYQKVDQAFSNWYPSLRYTGGDMVVAICDKSEDMPDDFKVGDVFVESSQ